MCRNIYLSIQKIDNRGFYLSVKITYLCEETVSEAYLVVGILFFRELESKFIAVAGKKFHFVLHDSKGKL